MAVTGSTACPNCGHFDGRHAHWCKENATVHVSVTTANDRQVAGDHYKSKAIQPWDYIASNNIGYLEGNVIKYVSRWRDKGGVADLEKARHYLDKLIELQGK
jgi:hypothetical protein